MNLDGELYAHTRLVHGDTDVWSLYWAGYFVCAPTLEDHTERLFRRFQSMVSILGQYIVCLGPAEHGDNAMGHRAMLSIL